MVQGKKLDSLSDGLGVYPCSELCVEFSAQRLNPLPLPKIKLWKGEEYQGHDHTVVGVHTKHLQLYHPHEYPIICNKEPVSATTSEMDYRFVVRGQEKSQRPSYGVIRNCPLVYNICYFPVTTKIVASSVNVPAISLVAMDWL